MALIAKWLVGIVLILGGLGYAALRLMSDAAGDPNQGALGGLGPILVGLGVTAAGVVVLLLP